VQALSFSLIWAYGHHFIIQEKDDSRMTFDFGVQVYFDQKSHASGRDLNLIQGTLSYVEQI